MGDKFPRVSNFPLARTPSVVSPSRKTRKKTSEVAVVPPAAPTPTPTPAAGQRRRQTPAQRRASLANLAKARAARGR